MNTSIRTKYHPATRKKGSRITATATDGQKLSYRISPEDDFTGIGWHQAAADALCDKLGWPKERLIGGALSDGYVFVFHEEVQS